MAGKDVFFTQYGGKLMSIQTEWLKELCEKNDMLFYSMIREFPDVRMRCNGSILSMK